MRYKNLNNLISKRIGTNLKEGQMETFLTSGDDEPRVHLTLDDLMQDYLVEIVQLNVVASPQNAQLIVGLYPSVPAQLPQRRNATDVRGQMGYQNKIFNKCDLTE